MIFTESRKTEQGVEIKITRTDVPGECDTVFNTARAIAALPRDANFELECANLVKKHVHHTKLNVYLRCKEWRDIPSFLDDKIETHSRILDEWDLGKWRVG